MTQAVKYIEPQVRLAGKAGKAKKEYKLSMVTKETYEKIRIMAEEPIKTIFTDPAYGKVNANLKFGYISDFVVELLLILYNASCYF